jgi:hypothetical protein
MSDRIETHCTERPEQRIFRAMAEDKTLELHGVRYLCKLSGRIDQSRSHVAKS